MDVARFLRRLPEKLVTKFGKLRGAVFERLLERRVPVRHEGRTLFTLRNYSWTTAKRARTFSTKEPETLAWIDRFEPDDVLLDIGANVGIYSLYAGTRGHRVLALEPDALNFALLNLNVRDNGLVDRVTAYPYSLHTESVVAELHMRDCDWGGSQKSFGRNLDWKGEAFAEPHRQGSAGISVDAFVRQTGVAPAHIKIDVDGNELLVLEGAGETLRAPSLRSVLVELYDGHEEYATCVRLLEDAGFKLEQRAAWEKDAGRRGPITENHIFVR